MENTIFNPANRPLAKGNPDWFEYAVSFLALAGSAAGVLATQTFQIDASSQFLWSWLSYQANAVLGTSVYTQQTNPVPQVKILLTDGGSGRQLSSAALFLNTIAGVGGWPGRLIHPRLFDRNSSVTVQATSYEAATWGELQLVFGGFRIYG